MITLTKTDYILYRECSKNAWMKIHKPEIYYTKELSEFEKHIIETGNEVELVARKLFPTGVLIEGRDELAQEQTKKLIETKQGVLFQPVFFDNNLLAAVDVLKYNLTTEKYDIYEIKASSDVDKKVHIYDLAFQVVLLKACGLHIGDSYIIHLNNEYVRQGELDIIKLFTIQNVDQEIESVLSEVEQDIRVAQEYLGKDVEPVGPCCCIYKGRSKHCTTFNHTNPNVPSYGVHDISRIGNSKKKLEHFIENNEFNLSDIQDIGVLNDAQQNQILTYVSDRVIINHNDIKDELEKLEYPLYFFDYETYPSAIPLYDGYVPYDQIPFQYSLHVLTSPDAELTHVDFLYTHQDDPSLSLAESLQSHIGPTGSIIVWSKSFEIGRNKELATRLPQYAEFFTSLNNRVYDLMDIFTKQHYVHKDFKGKTSIKKILPVLAPELSYTDLEIREGGTASQTWKSLVDGVYKSSEVGEVIHNLQKYCERDTYAMYVIWKVLRGL